MIKQIIKRPVMVTMLLVGLSLLGGVSYYQMPVEFQPFVELPLLIVQVGTTRDADPSYVEKNGVIPVEQAIAGMEDVLDIESSIDRRRAMIFVYYRQKTNLKYAYLKLREKLRETQNSMETGFFVNVWKVDTEQLSNQFMTLQALGEGSLDQIREVVDSRILADLENIDGIANVEVFGGKRRSISVILDEGALKAHHLTASQIESKLGEGNRSRQFLGTVVDGQKQTFVNLSADYTSLSRLSETVIKEQGPVLLHHVARIVDGGAEEESIARVNGQEAIQVVLVREQTANLLALSKTTRTTIDDINRRIAHTGVHLIVESDSAEMIADSIGAIKELGLIGGLLAVLVLWVFLRNIRLVLIVALALPMSIIIAMNFIAWAGITINSLSLMGIAIAVGMLLDNSIVVLENIYRQMARGMTPYQAVTSGTREVSRAIIAATLTTVCVFMPFIYSGNFLTLMIGRNIGLAIISTLLVSLGVAFLLIPAFAYFFLTRKTVTVESFNKVRQKNRLLQIYTLLLKSCLRFPARTIVIAVVAFFVSIAIAIAVSINVSEELNETEFNLYATMPSGTTLKSADEQVIEMDSRLVKIEELEKRSVNISEDNVIFRFVLREDFEAIAGRDLAGVKSVILEELGSSFQLVDFSYQQPTGDSRFRGGGGGRGRGEAGLNRMLGIGSSEEMVTLRGHDISLLLDVADDIRFNLDNLGTISRTSISIASRQQEIHLLFDWAAMHHFGVTTTALIGELSNFQSEVSSGITLDYGTEKVEIVLTQENLEEKQSDDLRELAIPSLGGGTIPLSQLAQLIYTNGNANINRVNQEKQVEVRYRFERDINDTKQLLDNARLEVEQIVGDINIPDGIGLEILHDETDLSEYYILILAAMILIYMILASVFESLLTPISMMFTLPLASIGALWGLILTGNTLFSANSMVGILILMGVIVNNGIILIDYSRILRKNGYRRTRALIAAGQARVRPILITASTTILAMLPLAMGKSAYVAQMGAPFAITVIGGMTVGTLFTLILIPTVAFGLENSMIWYRSLKTSTKLIQLAFFVFGVLLIYQEVESILWQTANTVALFGLIPSLTYFIQTSLRRSRSDLIPKGEPITISIRNVVKNYDGFSRFTREWRKAERQRANMINDNTTAQSGPTVFEWLWRGPLILFHAYFAYLYLESGIWTVIFTAGFYMHFLSVLSKLDGQIDSSRLVRLRRLGYKIIYWFGPALNMGWYYLSWDNLGAVIVPFLIWYPAIWIYATASKLRRTGLNIARVKGRFARLKRLWYRLVLAIPILGKRKKPFKALDQVSLEIGSGMFGLVGPNGAGKTTLMRIICGILEQSRGKVTINGIDISEKCEELQSLIGYLPQEFGTYENMTAESFLDYQALLKGLWDHDYRKRTVDRAISSVHLDDARGRKIKAFSGGMRQRVGIAQTLLHLPRILVVDEPTAGLDPRERIRFRNLLTDLARDRVVIFSTHIIEDISSSCNRLAVMNNGRIQFIGSPQELVNLTEGSVWQAEMDEELFEKIRTEMKVVHHMNDKGRIRVRILAADKPLDNALPVRPTLEDSYLWLLGDNKENHNGAFA